MQFSDHVNSPVHPETNFGKFFATIGEKQANGGYNLFQPVRGERQDIQVEIC